METQWLQHSPKSEHFWIVESTYAGQRTLINSCHFILPISFISIVYPLSRASSEPMQSGVIYSGGLKNTKVQSARNPRAEYHDERGCRVRAYASPRQRKASSVIQSDLVFRSGQPPSGTRADSPRFLGRFFPVGTTRGAHPT